MVLWFRRGNTCFGLVQGSWYTASEIVAMSQVVRGMGTSFVTFWSSIFGSWNCSKGIKVKSVCCSSGHRSFTHISIHAYDFWKVPKDWWGWGAACCWPGESTLWWEGWLFLPLPPHTHLWRGERGWGLSSATNGQAVESILPAYWSIHKNPWSMSFAEPPGWWTHGGAKRVTAWRRHTSTSLFSCILAIHIYHFTVPELYISIIKWSNSKLPEFCKLL